MCLRGSSAVPVHKERLEETCRVNSLSANGHAEDERPCVVMRARGGEVSYSGGMVTGVVATLFPGT